MAFVEKVKAVHVLEGINMDMTVRPWSLSTPKVLHINSAKKGTKPGADLRGFLIGGQQGGGAKRGDGK